MSTIAPFENRRQITIAVQIHHRLRQEIVSGALPPRHPLSENELATSLAVSRTPVREALGKLEEEGLVQIVPQYGTFVAPIQVERVYGNQFIREALECAAIAVAAERCTVADAEQLRAIVAQQRESETETAFFAADEAMHARLMVISGHENAWPVVEAAKLHLDRVRHLAVHSTMKRQSILAEHQVIIDRVIGHDPAGAVEAMRTHLRGVFASIEPVMREHPDFFAEPGAAPRPPRRAAMSRGSRGSR